MAVRKHIPPNPNQMSLNLRFKRKYDLFVESTRALGESLNNKPIEYNEGSDISACYAVANAVKAMMKASGIEQKQMPDLINTYFGRSEELASQDKPGCLKPLTLPYFKNYMSKPAECRLPAYYVFAIQDICKSLTLSELFAAPHGGVVISAEENRLLLIAQLQEKQRKMKELEIELKKASAF